MVGLVGRGPAPASAARPNFLLAASIRASTGVDCPVVLSLPLVVVLLQVVVLSGVGGDGPLLLVPIPLIQGDEGIMMPLVPWNATGRWRSSSRSPRAMMDGYPLGRDRLGTAKTCKAQGLMSEDF